VTPNPPADTPPCAEAPVHDPVAQTIDSIAAMHVHAESQVGRHQRLIERITRQVGRPGFFYGVLGFVGIWIGLNLGGRPLGLAPWDKPPFYWLQGVVGLGALLVTTIVLITQNRQGRLAERRAQLDLQINLLAEQKITKLVALVEELRRDLPSVRNRHDPQAEAMSEAADPAAVLSALEETLSETALEAQEPLAEAE